MSDQTSSLRNLLVVFGDQLSDQLDSFKELDPSYDAVLMMEVREEATYIPEHKIRLVLLFSAMRHLCEGLREKGVTVHCAHLDDKNNRQSFAHELGRWLKRLKPQRVIGTKPGDFRVEAALCKTADEASVPLEIHSDNHFMCGTEAFAEWAEGRDTLRLEDFYRAQRKRLDILTGDGKPAGGAWNFDKDNRKRFSSDGPPEIKAPRAFRHDKVAEEVIGMVEAEFPNSLGSLDSLDYPVSRSQALAALRDFVGHRLCYFGDYQDAMATGHPYLHHSWLSCVLNLHLLDPHEAVEAAVEACETGAAPINAVESFVRQILGWREFVRRIDRTRMPDYAELNALDADLDMPAFVCTAETDMNCVRQCVEQLQSHAYAHHIQRLMVLGLLRLVLGVRPGDVHRWHMSMYADAVGWVSLPNVLGMSQYVDGGIMASKPYAASGNYINKMSDNCSGCRYTPGKATGQDACPFTTLFWAFLSRNRSRLDSDRRVGFMYGNLDRKDQTERRKIKKQADALLKSLTQKAYLT